MSVKDGVWTMSANDTLVSDHAKSVSLVTMTINLAVHLK